MIQIPKCGSVSCRGGVDEMQSFADKHRLKARISEDGTKIIPGKFGHIYEYDDELFGVLVIPNPPRRRYWGCTRASLRLAGLTVVQDGDGEGAVTFDPINPEQAKAAIQAASVKRKRTISPEQREQQIARLRASAGRALSAAGTRRKATTVQRPAQVDVSFPTMRAGEKAQCNGDGLTSGDIQLCGREGRAQKAI